MDIDAQLENVAFGMVTDMLLTYCMLVLTGPFKFKLINDPERYADHNKPISWGFYEDEQDAPGDDRRSILKYEPKEHFSIARYDLPEGQWVGHYFSDEYHNRANGMIQLEIGKPSPEGHFEGRGYAILPFTIKGTIEPSGTSDFNVTYTRSYVSKMKIFCTGTLDGKTGIIRGTWCIGQGTGDLHGPMQFLQMPASIYQFWYTDAQFASSPARARWSFACSVVHHQIQVRLWSWKLMKTRFVERRRYVDLITRLELAIAGNAAALDKNEDAELQSMNRRLPTPDRLLYYSIAEYKNRKTTRHM
jgi:hypothetical protein